MITDPHIVSKQLDPLVPVSRVDLLAVCLLKEVEGLIGNLEDFKEHLFAGRGALGTFFLDLVDLKGEVTLFLAVFVDSALFVKGS